MGKARCKYLQRLRMGFTKAIVNGNLRIAVTFGHTIDNPLLLLSGIGGVSADNFDKRFWHSWVLTI